MLVFLPRNAEELVDCFSPEFCLQNQEGIYEA